MKILAIDPGTNQSAYVIWDGNIISHKGKVDNDILLLLITNGVNVIDKAYIERVASYGMAVGQTVFDTCVWIGRFQQALVARHVPTKLIFRKDVKMYWCGQTRAKDSNIIRAIKDRYGDKGSKKNGFNKTYNDEVEKMVADIWQAFALAVQAFDEVI